MCWRSLWVTLHLPPPFNFKDNLFAQPQLVHFHPCGWPWWTREAAAGQQRFQVWNSRPYVFPSLSRELCHWKYTGSHFQQKSHLLPMTLARQRRKAETFSACHQFLNGFIFGINIPESHTVTNVSVKKDYKSIYTILCTELDKSIHSIQYSSCRSRDSFAVQSAKALERKKILISQLKQDSSYQLDVTFFQKQNE